MIYLRLNKIFICLIPIISLVTAKKFTCWKNSENINQYNMNDQSNLNNYIIILGTTKSGSNAIYDYLAGRGDLNDPLQGTEYQLPQMPNGLMTLEAISGKAFHPHTADFVLAQFEEITNTLFRPWKPWRHGKNYSSMLPLFKKEIEKFIDEICAAKLPMRLHWHKLMQPSVLYLFSNLKSRIGFTKVVPDTRLIVSQDNFILAAQKFHDRLFKTSSTKLPILLNQAGSGWNPIESTKYFTKRKVVYVTRNPFDQFAELKQIKKAVSVEGFIAWYQEMQRRLKEINNLDILHLRFEDFVNQNEKMIGVLCTHLLIPLDISSSYESNLSKKNIGKYQKILNQKEIEAIKQRLSEYIYV